MRRIFSAVRRVYGMSSESVFLMITGLTSYLNTYLGDESHPILEISRQMTVPDGDEITQDVPESGYIPPDYYIPPGGYPPCPPFLKSLLSVVDPRDVTISGSQYTSNPLYQFELNGVRYYLNPSLLVIREEVDENNTSYVLLKYSIIIDSQTEGIDPSEDTSSLFQTMFTSWIEGVIKQQVTTTGSHHWNQGGTDND